MEKMRMESVDLTAQNIDKIGKLFPNCITETVDETGKLKKAINFEMLKQMLSGDVIDGDEAYEFTWVGKKASIVEANKPIRKTLRPCREESVNWDTTENLYIEGDNLEVLKLLQESYLGKVKMIYIDPPYNTGSDKFVYPDNYKISQDEYNEESGLFDDDGNLLFCLNAKSNPRFHSKWCSMIYERLLIARNLLAETGAIFVHIDEHEVYTLQMICNEVFGAQNELGTIIWDKRNPKGVVAGVAYQHESIIVYCKNITSFAGTKFVKKKENAELMLKKVDSLVKKYGYVNDDVRKEFKAWINTNKDKLTGGEKAYSLIDDQGRLYQPVSMAAPDKPETRSHRPLIHPITGLPCPVPSKGWRFTDETMDELIKIGKIEFGEDENTQPRQKYYLIDNMEEAVSSLLYYGGADNVLGLPFDNPKPVYVAKRIISTLAKDDGDIVMDFFAGSSTTAHAVMELNAEDNIKRKYILVQYPEEIQEKTMAYNQGYRYITEIGKKRICLASEKIRNENKDLNIDSGFRVFKLDESNMTDVYYSPTDYNQDLLSALESNVKSDRNDLDLLFGCLLEWGLPLSLPYSSEQIDGCTVHNYNDGDLIACFDENVPENVIKEIAKKQPLRAVFRDSSFVDSPSKINVGEIFKLMAPDTRVKVI